MPRKQLNLAKDVKVNPKSSLKHSWAKVFKTVQNNLGINGVPDAAYQVSIPRLIGSGEDFESILTIFLA